MAIIIKFSFVYIIFSKDYCISTVLKLVNL